MAPVSRKESGERLVVPFAEGSASMRLELGNKGANLAEMVQVLGPELVPDGFCLTTTASLVYMEEGGDRLPNEVAERLAEALSVVEAGSGLTFGDPDRPLLVSVRSGAPVSMPGMMDSVLNVGMNEAVMDALSETAAGGRFARDSFRRLIQMYGEVVRGLPPEPFEDALTEARSLAGVGTDAELDEGALEDLVRRFLGIYELGAGERFPSDPMLQLARSVEAVFRSWGNERAVTYRRLNGIPDDLGTGVVVQRMVFGNMGGKSGSGVAFSRDPTTGDPEPVGDYLADAQGEDVVAGIRNTGDLDDLAAGMPAIHAELIESIKRLEMHFRDIQDIEFTIEDGQLFILQTRDAKRHARAAVRFACDARAEGLLSREEALSTIEPAALTALLHPSLDSSVGFEELSRGVPASPGAARGAIVLSAGEAVRRESAGEDVILVRTFTSAEDVAGFNAARGILTAQGGKSSHAAIVARGMGRPCVCGAGGLSIDPGSGSVQIGGLLLREGDLIAIDGTTGQVTADEVRLVPAEPDPHLEEVLRWADGIRSLGVRANADSADDAARARELGAEGIGLCRTEHMFFGADRDRLVRQTFIAGELARRERMEGDSDRYGREFRQGLVELGEIQRADFREIFMAMEGLPVTIRLLDPPLHEFIPVQAFENDLALAKERGDRQEVAHAERNRRIARDLEEVNPMLGTRGIRLALLLPGLYEMQTGAIIEAALEVEREGHAPRVEIMVPLVAWESELDLMAEAIDSTAADLIEAAGSSLEVSVGTMVELPRTCEVADLVAARADFFSFGTNDLTQTALGLSRDDAERAFLPDYLTRGLVTRNPFETIDTPGVGALIETAVRKGREANGDLGLGICGEHGGDPDSIAFFHRTGFDYVSCSPFRIPVARVAAAQAAIGDFPEPGQSRGS